jgi:hypothetical protein
MLLFQKYYNGYQHLGLIPFCFFWNINKILTLVVYNWDPLARVMFPMAIPWQIYKCDPNADGMIGFMDGLAVTSECTSESVK